MKKILAIAMVALMIAAMSVTAFAADIETGLVGYYTFDETLKNEVGGEAEIIGAKFAAPVGEATYADGKLTTSNAVTDGYKLDVKLEKDFTVSFYCKVESYIFASPMVWMGGSDQSTESWIGIWSTFNGANGLSIGSNDTTGARVGAEVAVTYPTEEVYVTVTVADGVGTLYHNGVEVAKTADGALLPNPWADKDDCAIYIGANYWDVPSDATYENLTVYNRALSADDVAALYAAGGVPTTGDAPQTGFATAALAVVAVLSGAYIVTKKH